MKKVSKFLCGIFLAVSMALGIGFANTTSNHEANAAGVVTVTFNLNGGKYGGNTLGFALDTDADGFLSEYPVPTHDNLVFAGWFRIGTITEIDIQTYQFTEAMELEARWTNKTNSYTISTYTESSSDYISVLGHTTNQIINYLVVDGITSINDAIDAIKTDLYNPTVVTLEFNSFNLIEDETINLDFENVLVKGSIASTFEKPVFELNPQADNSAYTFEDVEISNNAHDVLIYPNPTTNKTASITLKTFEVTSNQENSFAVKFESTNFSLTVAEIPVEEDEDPLVNTQNTTHLFNYVDGLSLDFSTKLNNSLSNPLTATLDYVYDNVTIINNFSLSNSGRFVFVAKAPYYSIVSTIMTASYIVDSAINFDFDLNGATYATPGYELPLYNYSAATKINFPADAELSKTHSTFDTWFGIFELTDDEKTAYGLSRKIYYYDLASLVSLRDAGYDLTKLDELFKTSMSGFETSNGFTGYKFNAEPTSTDDILFEFAVSTNKVPSLIARWVDNIYTITLNTNGGSTIEPIKLAYGSTVTAPADPTKPGYSFIGWFVDESLRSPYTFTTMPDRNFELFAGWEINEYTVTFINGQITVATFTANFGEQIEFPETMSKIGHNFDYWCTDEALTTRFTEETVPAANTTLYAKWSLKTCYIYLIVETMPDFNNVNFTVSPDDIVAKYGEAISKPANPVAEGYEFDGWYTSTDFLVPFKFEAMKTQSTWVYAKWIIKQYTITYITGTNPSKIENSHDFNTEISFPAQPKKAGYNFDGWYMEESCETPISYTLMPAKDFTVYAKWIAKAEVIVNAKIQKIEVDSNRKYQVDSDLENFLIEYLVDGAWTRNAPTEIGTYDVRLYRAEDNEYAEYSIVIKDGFVISQKTLDLTWLIILIYVLLAFEIIAIIFIKKMQKSKRIQPATVASVVLPFGIITTTQFVFLIIGGTLLLFGLAYIIFELVKLHRIVPIEQEEPSVYDTRSRFENMVDKSEDTAIASKVDELIKREGLDLIKPKQEESTEDESTDIEQ